MGYPPSYGTPTELVRRRCSKCRLPKQMLGGTTRGGKFVCRTCRDAAENRAKLQAVAENAPVELD